VNKKKRNPLDHAGFFAPGRLTLPPIYIVEKNKETLRIQMGILIIAVVLFSIKIAAWWITRSVAILTDALESIVNIIAAVIGYYSLTIAFKPRDHNHPYGHGKAEFLSAAIEGTLIMLAGLFIIYEAILHLIYPRALEQLGPGIFLMIITALINFGWGYFAVRKGRANRSEALQASGKHLKSDTYSTLAVIAGLILIWFTGVQALDSIVAMLNSIVIMVIGYRIARKSVAGIMDEADDRILSRLIDRLNISRQPNWIDIHNLRVIQFGNILHVDCHMTVPWYLTVRQAHEEIDVLQSIIENEFGSGMEFFVHEDDCVGSCCPICMKSECPVREHEFQKKIAWKMQNITPNQKHDLQTPG